MFNAGATNLQAMIGGDVQIMAGGVPETVLARASGADIKNFWAISNVMPFQIYGRPNMKSMKDGKGKKFAISRFGSLSEFLTRSALRQSRESIPRMSRCCRSAPLPRALLRSHRAWSTRRFSGFPVTERAKAIGMNKLYDLKDLYPNWTNVGFVAREVWLAKEKEQAMRFLRAYQRGVRHTRENREDGIRALRKYVGLDASEAAAGYDEYRDSFPLDGRILDAGITATIEQELEAGRLKGKISASEMIDHGFINLMGKSSR